MADKPMYKFGVQKVVMVASPPVGKNAFWTGSVGVGAHSPTIETLGNSRISFAGNISGTPNLTMDVSVDGTNWYVADHIDYDGSGNVMHLTQTLFPYVRLTTDAAATVGFSYVMSP